MATREEILSFLKEMKEYFFQEYNLVSLGLFGSYAINEATETSDIDVIVEFKDNTENLSEKKTKIKETISKRFNRDVDLCREKYIKPYFKLKILESTIYV